MPTRYSIHNGDCFSAGGFPAARGSGRRGAGWRGDRGRRREWLGKEQLAASGGGVGETGIGCGGSRRAAPFSRAGTAAGRRPRLLTGGRAGHGAHPGAARRHGAAARGGGAGTVAARASHRTAGFARRGTAAATGRRSLVAGSWLSGRQGRPGGDAARLRLPYRTAREGMGCGGGAHGSAVEAGRRPRAHRESGVAGRIGPTGWRTAERRTGGGAGHAARPERGCRSGCGNDDSQPRGPQRLWHEHGAGRDQTRTVRRRPGFPA